MRQNSNKMHSEWFPILKCILYTYTANNNPKRFIIKKYGNYKIMAAVSYIISFGSNHVCIKRKILNKKLYRVLFPPINLSGDI